MIFSRAWVRRLILRSLYCLKMFGIKSCSLIGDNFVYSVLSILLNFTSSGFLRQLAFLLLTYKSEGYFKIK